MPRPRHSLAALVLFAIAAAPLCAQEVATSVDPLAILTTSASTIEASPQFSAALVTSITVVRDEQESNQQQVVQVTAAAPNKFALAMVKPSEDFWVRSDGQQTMTYVAPLGRYAVTDQQSGMSDFAQSQLSGMLGNGFGRVVFGLLDSESAKSVAEAVTESEYLGTETVEEQELHHCRYTSGDRKWDAWFTTGDAPLLWRLSPDLSEMFANSPAAQQFEEFRVEISFTLRDVDQETEIDETAFALDAPEGAQKVEIGGLFAPPPRPPHNLLGRKAPVFDAVNLAGEPIDLGELVGKKIVILDFWATWCGPCVAALPKINKVAGEYAEKGVVFYAVNQGEDVETINQFLTDQELDVPVAMDAEREAGTAYSIEGLPTSIVIGKDGSVQVVHVGFSPQLEESLREELDALLEGEDLASEVIAEWNEENPDNKIDLADDSEAGEAEG